MNRFPFPPYRSGIPHWSERVVTYCAKVLPLVFDNSLSYYEFLGHVQSKLNQVIEALNNQNLVFVEFTHMIELELQNFEKYMDERQSNFEQSMQDEWTAFKADMEEAWGAFKTQMEEAWAAEQELNARFRTDMQAAFTQFQSTIQERQTAFETALRNQQNQFQTDLTSRQNTFEDTMEDNFERWKVDTLAALQAGIQQFETNALAAIRAELPAMILDAVDDEVIEPMVQAETARQGFAKILSTSNDSEGAAIDLTNEYISIYRGGTIRLADVTIGQFTTLQISPGSSLVFTSQSLWENVGKIRAVVTKSDFPASGWKMVIGKYTTSQAISTEFNEANFTELVSSPISRGSTVYYANSGAGVDAGRGYYQYVCIRFMAADPANPPAAFTCDFTQGIEMFKAGTADLVVQSGFTGNKYAIPKSAPVYDIPTLTSVPTVVMAAYQISSGTITTKYHLLLLQTDIPTPTGLPQGSYIAYTFNGPISIYVRSDGTHLCGALAYALTTMETPGTQYNITIPNLHAIKVE